jgi:anhydro-N-acetylmuramic acid kinase
MNRLLKILGLMSGTSLDGLDIALVEIYETRNNFHIKNISFKTYDYTQELKDKLLKNIDPEQAKLNELSDINFELGHLFSDYILEFLEENNLKPDEIDLIGSHGHTFFHSIKDNKAISTFQLGDPSVIAQKTGITTVGDFRNADIASGGQGAPLVPFLDYVLFKKYNKNIALQNIGGISNFSYIPASGDLSKLFAFDTGPGNMIIDSMIKKISNGKLNYDANGEMASKGKVNKALLSDLLSNAYFDRLPPKSTGREIFGEQYSNEVWNKAKSLNLSNEDIVSTVTFFTAKTISDAFYKFLPELPEEIVISGGGAKNSTLLKYLNELLDNKVEISNIEKYGILSDAKEAVAFALLAYCTIFGLPNNLKEATGASESLVMGKICPSKNYRQTLLKTIKNNEKIEVTEKNNLLSQELDDLTTVEIVELMNKSDYEVLESIDNVKKDIAKVMDQIIYCLDNGGKLFYIGAGTSGRLGVLDASECPPTFKTNAELVQGIIAGGNIALTTAVEGAEDSGEDGIKDIREKISEKDILIGISANGKAPYVIEALREAKLIGAKTALLTCNFGNELEFIDTTVVLDVGSEVLSGSTRLKAGTVTKMVLNMFTTGSFAKLGKAYNNYMVDVKVSNKKLKNRALKMLQTIANIDSSESDILLEKAEGSVKLALLMKFKNYDLDIAKRILEENKGFLKKCLNN